MQQNQTILLVDDDVDDHEFFGLALGKISNSITLLKAENGKAALELLENTQPLPDYIFLDLNMPAIDGKQFLKLIKKHPKFVELNVVMYTTSANEDDIKETLALGAKHFLTKPDTIDDIAAKVAVIISS